MTMDVENLQWLGQNYQVNINLAKTKLRYYSEVASSVYGSGLTSPTNTVAEQIHSEKVFQLEIGERDLAQIIHVLQKADTHALLQNRYPGIREAYMNYMTTIMLTADHTHANKIY